MNILYEYENIKDKDLVEHIKKNETLHKYFSFNWGKLSPKQYCGVLSFDEKDYYLLPKISKEKERNLKIFIYMLMYAYDVKLENEDIASCVNEKHTILEIFVQLFAKNLLRQFQNGVYKEYISKEENLKVLKGKYLINENLKYNFTKDKIYCQFDEFCENNMINQLFLYAIKTFKRHVKNKKILKKCELILDEVEYKNIDIDNLNIHFNRLNTRYKMSVEFAIMLLKRFIAIFKKDKKSFAFLFDMNELFEKFIGKIVKSINPNAKLQNEKDFGSLKLKPDILCQDIIIDTKYKIITSYKDIKASDKYQMYVYANNFDIQKTMLLYPKYYEAMNKELILGENEKMVKLWIKTVDLDFKNDGFSEYVSEIRSRVKW